MISFLLIPCTIQGLGTLVFRKSLSVLGEMHSLQLSSMLWRKVQLYSHRSFACHWIEFLKYRRTLKLSEQERR